MKISKTVISFDFWNTLYADGAEIKRMIQRKALFRKILNQYTQVSDVQLDTAFQLSTQFFMREWREKLRTPTAEERIEVMTDHLRVNLQPEDLKYVAEQFGNLIMRIPPIEIAGAKKIVRSLSKQVSLGIISDTGYIAGRHIRQFLDREGILECFSSLTFSDEHANSKPHLSVFEKTAKELGANLKYLVHIGDLERTDILGALNAGCQSIKFTGANHQESTKTKANLTVDNYDSLYTALQDHYL